MRSDRRERCDPTRLTRLRRDEDDADAPLSAKAPRHLRNRTPLVCASAIADGTRGAVRRDAVDDHLGERHAGAIERRQTIFAFSDRQLLRQQHPVEGRAPGVAQPRACVTGLIGQHADQAVGGLRPADARELFANHAVLALHLVKYRRDRGHSRRRGEQT